MKISPDLQKSLSALCVQQKFLSRLVATHKRIFKSHKHFYNLKLYTTMVRRACSVSFDQQESPSRTIQSLWILATALSDIIQKTKTTLLSLYQLVQATFYMSYACICISIISRVHTQSLLCVSYCSQSHFESNFLPQLSKDPTIRLSEISFYIPKDDNWLRFSKNDWLSQPHLVSSLPENILPANPPKLPKIENSVNISPKKQKKKSKSRERINSKISLLEFLGGDPRIEKDDSCNKNNENNDHAPSFMVLNESSRIKRNLEFSSNPKKKKKKQQLFI